MSKAAKSKPLIRDRRFWPLFALIQTVTFNDNALKNALIGLLTFVLSYEAISEILAVAQKVPFAENLEKGSLVPIAAFIFTLPFLMLSAVAGQIADKIDRAVIFKRVKSVEFFIMLLAAIGFWFMNIWVLAIALFFMGAQSAFVTPTKNAVLPQWLTDEELIPGNGILNGFVFVFILIGMVVGLFVIGIDGGPKILAVLLLVMSVLGWIAARFQPAAPAPKPKMKVNYEPVTATWSVLKHAFNSPHVLRPMLGIAWFYGLSNVIILALPEYLKTTMGYDRMVLIFILMFSTVGILIGSLLCAFVAKRGKWGKESIGLTALGITGVTLFALDIYLFGVNISVAEPDGTLKGLSFFWEQPGSKRLFFDVVMASLCNGLFVVPMQAMAQRRADPAIRARLMSAGAVLLNISVNVITVLLIIMASKSLPPKSPFLIIIIGSALVSMYTIFRTIKPRDYVSHVGEG
ncbi:MAG: MFS transporter [Alphaproteobacteria bacterium]